MIACQNKSSENMCKRNLCKASMTIKSCKKSLARTRNESKILEMEEGEESVPYQNIRMEGPFWGGGVTGKNSRSTYQ